MKKRTPITICLMFAALVVGITWSVFRTREPSYEGRKLSSWLEEYSGLLQAADLLPAAQMDEDQRAQEKDREALCHIGTNAIPTLLEHVRHKDGEVKQMFISAVRNQRLLKVHLRTADNYHSMAIAGFVALGSTAKDAVPALIESLQSRDFGIQHCAIDCLGNIGPEAKDAVPILLRFINDTNLTVQGDAIFMIGRIHQEPDIAIPALTSKLNTTNDQFVIMAAIMALGAYGEDAKPAVPFLHQFATNSSLLQYVAREALKKINHVTSNSK